MKNVKSTKSSNERVNICEQCIKCCMQCDGLEANKKRHYTGIRLSYIHEDSGVNSKRKWRKERKKKEHRDDEEYVGTCMTCNHK